MKTFTSDFELENSGIEFFMFCGPQVLQVVGIICAVVCVIAHYGLVRDQVFFTQTFTI